MLNIVSLNCMNFFLVVYFIFVRDFEFVMYIYGLNFNKMV